MIDLKTNIEFLEKVLHLAFIQLWYWVVLSITSFKQHAARCQT